MNPSRRFSIAPMMKRTDRHMRYFLRLLSPHAYLYTEMVTANAILHGDQHRLLHFNEEEHPLALQIGGSDPDALAKAAKIGAEFGYDEINLNCGCPSDRVQSGRFGACLMEEPELVARCVTAIKTATPLPVTVKTRIGIDDQEDYEFLHYFVKTVSEAGCQTFIIHARKAWLKGLSPKENREIPPLRYDRVATLKNDFPSLEIILNGGIKTMQDIQSHLKTFDGVMIGRAAYENPYLLASVENKIFGAPALPTRIEILTQMMPYIERQVSQDVPLHTITRHLVGLFRGFPGARRWRVLLMEAGLENLKTALQNL